MAGGARLSVSLLVNAYDKDGGMPIHRWMRDDLLRYKDIPGHLRAIGRAPIARYGVSE